ncbi:MAG: hypothetical protein M1825_006156 [Sarcosagium campestre]|nr:MAG: hypothetical protein M1825_006156 [Sarcosagium campestre]
MASAVQNAAPGQPRVPRLAFRNPSYAHSEPNQPLNSPTSQRPRVPKLTFRNSSDALVDRKDTSHSASLPTTPSSLAYGERPSPTASFFDTGLPSPALSASSNSSLSRCQMNAEAPAKSLKKASSLFGFLKVKDPSTQAFKDYQKALEVAKSTAVVPCKVMPGVSSAKLPPSVPKVNSRWDGMPQMKEKERPGADSLNRKSILGLRSWASPQPLSTGLGSGYSANARSAASSINSHGSSDETRVESSCSSMSNLSWTKDQVKSTQEHKQPSNAQTGPASSSPEHPQSLGYRSTTHRSQTVCDAPTRNPYKGPSGDTSHSLAATSLVGRNG